MLSSHLRLSLSSDLFPLESPSFKRLTLLAPLGLITITLKEEYISSYT